MKQTTGDAVLQKRFCTDFLTKKMKINEGEVPQYFVQNSHPGIVTLEVFELAQAEFERRKGAVNRPSGTNCFSGRLVCGECNSLFGSKHWHAGSKYARVVWQCNHKRDGEQHCRTSHLYEEDIRAAFVQAFNRLFEGKAQLSEDYALILETLTDTAALDHEAAQLEEECAVVMEMLRRLVDENAAVAQDQTAYQQKYEPLAARYEAAKQRLDALHEAVQLRRSRRSQIQDFLNTLQLQATALSDWNEELWYNTVDHVVVAAGGVLRFVFKDGSEAEV